MNRRSIVRVHDVTRGAPPVAVVAAHVVAAHEVERRIEQPSLLQADEDRTSTVQRAEAAVAQSISRPPSFFGRLGDTDLDWPEAPSLEDPEHVAGLCDLPRKERLKRWQYAGLLGGRFGGLRHRETNGRQAAAR